MAKDKHYNEPGVMPEALEDTKGTDMPATRVMYIAIVVVAIISAIVLIGLQMFG